MRFRVAASSPPALLRWPLPLLLAALLTGCVQRPPPAPLPPNPYGYLKRSAVCEHPPLRHDGTNLAASMKTRSDDGLCEVIVSQPTGGAYASFVLSRRPEHGRNLIYNYNGHTYVTYTANTAYAGSDGFTAMLVTGPGAPRTQLAVDVSIDATGVAPPAPPPAAETKPVTPAPGKERHRRRRTVHKTPAAASGNKSGSGSP